MILFHPPVSKPGEPPPGLARLSGALDAHGIRHTLVDANIEALRFILERPLIADNTWTRRAYKRVGSDLADLKKWQTYSHPDRYGTAVRNLNHILQTHAQISGERLSLTNHVSAHLNPLESADLLRAFEQPGLSMFHDYFIARCTVLFEESDCTCVGISLCFLPQAIHAFALAGVIRRLLPTCTLVLGGSLIEAWHDIPAFTTMSSSVFDYVISGPGEAALLSILGVHEAGPGSATAPSFDRFDWNSYMSPGRILPYNTAHGCYWNKCTFCPENASRNVYRPYGHEVAIAQICDLARRYGPTLFHFTDSALSPAFLGRLGRERPGVPWYGFVRFERQFEDEAFVASLKESGCVMLELGIESGNERVLESISKGISLENVVAVLRNLKKFGIAVYGYILFGVPEEDEASARDTVAFLGQQAHLIDFLNISIFNMPIRGKGPDIHATREFYPGDLALYTDSVHPKGWDRATVRNFIDTVVKRNRAIARLANAKPPSFSSSHAPLFVLGKNRASV